MSPQTQEVLTRSVARKEASIADEQLHLQLGGKQARWMLEVLGHIFMHLFMQMPGHCSQMLINAKSWVKPSRTGGKKKSLRRAPGMCNPTI